MSDINFDLKQIRSFLAIISEKSFTGASRRLRVGQATISHHVNLLEESLGVTLLHRSRKAVMLTPEGEAFAGVCEKIVGSVDSLRAEITRGISHGTVKVAASTIPSAYIIPAAIAAVRADDPACTYNVVISDSRDTVELIKERSAEIGVVGNKIEHPLLSYRKIFRGDIVLVGKPDMPGRIAPSDVPSLSLVMREAGSGTRKACERALQKFRILPSDLTVVHESSTSESVREAVVAGIGVAFISRLAIENELAMKKLKIISVEGLSIAHDFYAVYHASHELSLPGKKLLKTLSMSANHSDKV